jgi:hypothetical protein
MTYDTPRQCNRRYWSKELQDYIRCRNPRGDKWCCKTCQELIESGQQKERHEQRFYPMNSNPQVVLDISL